MTVFQTPEPITVTVEFGIGDLRLVACESTETMVEVAPTDPSKEGDVNAAKQTRVEYADGVSNEAECLNPVNLVTELMPPPWEIDFGSRSPAEIMAPRLYHGSFQFDVHPGHPCVPLAQT